MADEMTEAVQQTTEARVDSTIDTRRENPMKVRPRSLQLVGMHLSDCQARVSCTATQNIIRVLNSNPTPRLTAKQALSYTRLTSIATLTGMTSAVCGSTLSRTHVGAPPSEPRVPVTVREK